MPPCSARSSARTRRWRDGLRPRWTEPARAGLTIVRSGRQDGQPSVEPQDDGSCRRPSGLVARAVRQRAQIAEPLQAPLRIVAGDERGDRGADLLGGAEDPAPDRLLLERAEEALDHAIALRLANKGVAQADAPVRELLGEVVRDVLWTMIGAHRDATRGTRADRAAAAAAGHRLRDRLEGGEATAIARHVMADHLGIEMIERGEDPYPPVLDRLYHAGVGAPEHIGCVGQDGAVMIVGRARRAAKRREQMVLAHQPEHPVAPHVEPKAIAQAGPDLAMALTMEGRRGNVSLDGGNQISVIDRWLPPAPSRRARLPRKTLGVIEARARHGPDPADPLHAIRPFDRRPPFRRREVDGLPTRISVFVGRLNDDH